MKYTILTIDHREDRGPHDSSDRIASRLFNALGLSSAVQSRDKWVRLTKYNELGVNQIVLKEILTSAKFPVKK